MPRTNFSDGQEIVFEDLNKISAAVERGMLDRFIYQLLLRTSDAFFSDSLLVEYQDPSTVSVRAGLGLQYDSAAVTPEPNHKPLYQAAAENLSLQSPHPSLNRIDIVVIKAELATEISATRKYKDASTLVVSNQTLVTQKEWGTDLQVVTGTPNASPVAPATPAGYLRIAQMLITAATGLGASGVTDERVIFNQNGAGGYDAVTGAGLGATHPTLAAAIASVSAGARILVAASETVNTTIAVNKNNLQIDFKPGVSLSKGSATLGMEISADGVRLMGGRFSGFSGGGDKAIQVTAAADYAMLRDVRFATCTTEIEDLGTATSIAGTVTE